MRWMPLWERVERQKNREKDLRNIIFFFGTIAVIFYLLSGHGNPDKKSGNASIEKCGSYYRYYDMKIMRAESDSGCIRRWGDATGYTASVTPPDQETDSIDEAYTSCGILPGKEVIVSRGRTIPRRDVAYRQYVFGETFNGESCTSYSFTVPRSAMPPSQTAPSRSQSGIPSAGQLSYGWTVPLQLNDIPEPCASRPSANGCSPVLYEFSEDKNRIVLCYYNKENSNSLKRYPFWFKDVPVHMVEMAKTDPGSSLKQLGSTSISVCPQTVDEAATLYARNNKQWWQFWL